MILRRPYAILIKYFKLIHILLFGLFVYILFSFRKIYLFLVDYVKKGTFNYTDNIANSYVPIVLLIILFLIIFLGVFIYLLMKRKSKPSLFYILLTAYSLIGFFLMIVYRDFYASLELTSYETLSVIIYRDIMAFLYYICFFFVGVLFIRAFGFDIKKFSFEKDKRELNLDVSDSEEVELGVSLDKYDAIKTIRKEKRELLYYYKENQRFFNILAGVIVISLILVIYIHFFVNNKVYKETSTVTLGNIDFKILSSFVTNENYFQEVISPNNYFLVLELQIDNKNDYDLYFDKEIFRINNDNNEYLYPATSYCSSFSDLGLCYTPDSKVIKGSQKYIILFKISSPVYEGYFEILKNKGDNYKYEKINLKSGNIEIVSENYKMNNDYFNISAYAIEDKASYKYKECENDNCVSAVKNLYPALGNRIVKLTVSNISDFSKDFLENYLGFYYNINGHNYDVSSSKIDILAVNENDVYISVPKIALSNKEIGVTFKTRRKTMYIRLGENNE